MALFQAAFRFYHEDSNPSFKQRPDFVFAANEEEAQKVPNKSLDIGTDDSATSVLLGVFKS
jgi:hypothetical protein